MNNDPGPIKTEPVVDVPEWLAVAWAIAVVLAIGALLVVYVFAFSAAMSSASHRDDTGLTDVAAVRAEDALTTPTHPEDPPPASEAPPSSGTPNFTQPRHDPAAVLPIIRNAAVEFGQDPERMIAVAFCESSLRPDAVGDGGDAVGLWQFHLATWTANARRLFGRDVGDQRTDPVKSSLVAAWMFSIGQSGQWTCAR